MAAALLMGVSTCASCVAANVLTDRYDNNRTGANLNETTLTTANVNTGNFGKLWSYAVDGAIQAQPLYVQNVNTGLGVRNVLYVVTMNDVVHAFDADSTTLVWQRDLRNPAAGVGAVPIVDLTYVPNGHPASNDGNIVGTVGIESTPVIDLGNQTMYLLARTKENGVYVQRLHALDIRTGAEKSGSPATIQGAVSGTGDGGTTVVFDPMVSHQRAGLALANGQIYIAWASHEDLHGYHGWVMSYDETTLLRTGVLCITPNATEGGIWMAGRAPAIDASGNVYYATANGGWDNHVTNFGESFIKLGTPNAGILPVLDWFTPSDWSELNDGDVDLGSAGPVLIPGTPLIIGGGKQSQLYLTSTTSLGGESGGNSGIEQTIVVNPLNYASETAIRAGSPVYWNRSGGLGPWLYVWADQDYLNAYHFNGATFDTNPSQPNDGPVSQSTFTTGASGGGVITLSANGSTAGSGIVWAATPDFNYTGYANVDGELGLMRGLLRAFDADNLGTVLWDSDQRAGDDMGFLPKYSSPIVANGRVYMASFSGFVSVYGLLPTQPGFNLTATVPVAGVEAGPVATANPGGSPSYAVAAGAVGGFNGNIALSVSGLPTGTTANWSSNPIAASAASTLTLTTSSTTPVGTYPLTITGTSGALAQTTSIALVVRPPRAMSMEFWTSVGCTVVGMGPAEVAGVVARPYWLSSEYAQRPNSDLPVPESLIDETGASTGAWGSWSAANETANSNVPDNPGDFRLMGCYLDPGSSSSGNATVQITNLPANAGGYDVFVYAAAAATGSARTGNYQISGPGISTTSTNVIQAANTNFSGTYVRANNSAGNYVMFPLGANVTGFTLTATPVGSAGAAPINGIQIVPDDIFRDGFE
ncbi:MAG: hypothetical protein JSR27_13235 [Proteobacteria bacterium]|nr:hypothetical protein [Pseudomonadota bacterium]